MSPETPTTMYKTKELNKNIAKSYLTIGDPYRDPHVIEGTNQL